MRFDVTDALHYESRAIRSALRESGQRLKQVKAAKVGPGLEPKVGKEMQRSWQLGTANVSYGDGIAVQLYDHFCICIVRKGPAAC